MPPKKKRKSTRHEDGKPTKNHETDGVMDELVIADEQLRAARTSFDREYDGLVSKMNMEQSILEKRLGKLNRHKLEIAKANGNANAAPDDLIEVNAGGEIVAARRSTLTQLKGTKLEALFSGRWEKELQRDSQGRIFLDVNPIGFRAIVDHLNEMAISSDDNPPSLPNVDSEHKGVLQHYVELFGLHTNVTDSNIITAKEVKTLHEWLAEDDLDGDFHLLYRSSQDGQSAAAFHSKCDDQGSTLTIIQTTEGFVFGGYSNEPWMSEGENKPDNRAFLFVLPGSDVSSSCKMRLKRAGDPWAIYHDGSYGPTFGAGHDIVVQEPAVTVWIGGLGNSYSCENTLPDRLSLEDEETMLTIEEMEVFGVSGRSFCAETTTRKRHRAERKVAQRNQINSFTESINKTMNAKMESLDSIKAQIVHLEESFAEETNFINAFASGDEKDVVVLNVSGKLMVTKRSTLQSAEDSVLAHQFDDSKWTKQGSNSMNVREWTPADVNAWAKRIPDITDKVANIFTENKITGNELLALNMEGLKMIGIKRAGTMCLLLEEIKLLKQSSKEVVTLIEHSPYCFGKILDYLRMKHHHSQGLVVEEPALPQVRQGEGSRFEKLVKYYFPGDSSKFILG